MLGINALAKVTMRRYMELLLQVTTEAFLHGTKVSHVEEYWLSMRELSPVLIP